jgi:hypothetical protein
MAVSALLAITQVSQNQNDKYITINDGVSALEQASNRLFTDAAIGAGPRVLTETEFTRNIVFDVSGSTGAFTLEVPLLINGAIATNRLFIVRNTDSNDCTVGGSTGATVLVQGGTNSMIYCDGTDCFEITSTAATPGSLVDWKDSVRVASTGNRTLSNQVEAGDSIDGVTLATGDRVLLKDQTTGSENGIYTVNATGAPTRATDFDANAEVTGGAAVIATEGTANADKLFVLTTNDPIVLDTTALAFSEISGGGGGATDFISLTDTPGSLTARQIMQVNNAGNALEGTYDAPGSKDSHSEDIEAGNITLTQQELGEHKHFTSSTNVVTAGRTVTLAAGSLEPKVFIFENPAGSTQSVSVVRGSTSISVGNGVRTIFYADGSTDGLVQVSTSASGGASAFTDLTDVPSVYTGQDNKVPVVNDGETGLEFVDELASSYDTHEEDIEAASITLDATEMRQHVRFTSSQDVATASRTVTVDAGFTGPKLFIVENPVGSSESFGVVRGSTTVTVAAGEAVILYMDGSANNLKKIASSIDNTGGGGGGSGTITVRVATVQAGSLSSSFDNGSTIDGVSLVTGDRILIKNQSAASAEDNGIYTVNASGAPTRAADFDESSEIFGLVGVPIFVQEGTLNQNRMFYYSANAAPVLETDDIIFQPHFARLNDLVDVDVAGNDPSVDQMLYAINGGDDFEYGYLAPGARDKLTQSIHAANQTISAAELGGNFRIGTDTTLTDLADLNNTMTLNAGSYEPKMFVMYNPLGSDYKYQVVRGTSREDIHPGTHKLMWTDGSSDSLEVIAHNEPEVMKRPVRAASTANGTLATDFEAGDTLDGVTLAQGDRILLKDQTTGSENGIYEVEASGAPTRVLDYNDQVKVFAGVTVYCQEGTANEKTFFTLVTTGTITIDTTSLVYESYTTA